MHFQATQRSYEIPLLIKESVFSKFSAPSENQANVLELIGNEVQYDLWVA